MTDDKETFLRLSQLVDKLVDVKNLGNRLDEGLVKKTNQILTWLGVDKEIKKENVEEVLNILRQVLTDNPTITFEQIEEKFLIQEGRDEFETKALDSQTLEILLDEFDSHQSLKEAEKIAEAARKNPALKKIDQKAIVEAIRQKIKLQNEAVSKGKSQLIADLETDLQMVTESKLEEAGVQAEKAKEIATKVVEVAIKSESIDESRTKINGLLDGEKIGSDLKSAVEEKAVNKTAEVIVAIKEEGLVDSYLEKLKQDFQITPEKEAEIREVIKSRIEIEIEQSLPKVNEKQIVKEEQTVKAESLADKVMLIVGGEVNKEKLEIISRETEIETDKFISNQAEIVGTYRRNKIENSIRSELVSKGEDVVAATEKADYWGKFIYPPKQEAEMVAADEAAIQKGRESGYEGENLKLAAKRAQVVTRLINSPKSIEENVAEMMKKGEGVSNEYTDVARQLSRDQGARRSLEYIRQSVNFKKKIDSIVGKSAINLGKIFRSEKLVAWGENLLSTVASNKTLINFSQAATTWFGWAQNNQLGLNWALNKISDTWLGLGLKPIQIGETLTKLGGPNLTTLGNNLLSLGKIGFKKGGINALGALKGMASKIAPKLAAGLGKAALATAAWPLAILSLFDLKEIFKWIMYVVGGLFVGLLVIIPLLTLGPISSIVPTTGAGLGQNIDIGRVDEHGNPITVSGSAPGLPAGFLSGAQCDASAYTISTTYKQCQGSWSSTPLPSNDGGTVCSSGCGPTSVSMVVSRFNGVCTPDQMYYNQDCGSQSYAGSGEGGTGVYQNFNALSKFLPGRVSITGCSSAKEIANFICGGNLVMVLADFYYNSSGNVGGHYFLAVGVKDGHIVVKDPYYPKSDPFDGKVEYGSIYKVYNCILIKG